MLEFCPALQPSCSGLAVDNGSVRDRLRHGTAIHGCAPTTLGRFCEFKAENRGAVEFGFTALHVDTRSGMKCRTVTSEAGAGSYLESTLAEKRGRGLATVTSLLRAWPDSSLAESYSCSQNQVNSFGLILFQEKVGSTPSLK
jgi:hypothetical protein